MHKLILLVLALLTLLSAAAPVDTEGFLVHTDNATLLNKIGVKRFIDFAQSSPDFRTLKSFDGTGIKLRGIYFHQPDESINTRNATQDADPIPQLVKRQSPDQVPVFCTSPNCLHNDAAFSDLQSLSYLTGQACGFVLDNIHSDWSQQDWGWGIWFNNVACDDGVLCSMWIGVGVQTPPASQLQANKLLSICESTFMNANNACNNLGMGSATWCYIDDGTPGSFQYSWRAFPGAAWGYPCAKKDMWQQLDCGHMYCTFNYECNWWNP